MIDFATWPFAIVGAFGLLPPRRPTSLSSYKWLFHVWLFFLLLWYFSDAESVNAHTLILTYSGPIIAVFCGNGLCRATRFASALVKGSSRNVMLLGLLVVLCYFSLFRTTWIYDDFHSEDRYLGLQLRNLSERGDLIVSMGTSPVALYYSGRDGWLFPPAELWSDPRSWKRGDFDLETLDNLLNSGVEWIIVAPDNDYVELDRRRPGIRSPVIFDTFFAERLDLVAHSEYGIIYRARRHR